MEYWILLAIGFNLLLIYGENVLRNVALVIGQTAMGIGNSAKVFFGEAEAAVITRNPGRAAMFIEQLFSPYGSIEKVVFPTTASAACPKGPLVDRLTSLLVTAEAYREIASSGKVEDPKTLRFCLELEGINGTGHWELKSKDSDAIEAVPVILTPKNVWSYFRDWRVWCFKPRPVRLGGSALLFYVFGLVVAAFLTGFLGGALRYDFGLLLETGLYGLTLVLTCSMIRPVSSLIDELNWCERASHGYLHWNLDRTLGTDLIVPSASNYVDKTILVLNTFVLIGALALGVNNVYAAFVVNLIVLTAWFYNSSKHGTLNTFLALLRASKGEPGSWSFAERRCVPLQGLKEWLISTTLVAKDGQLLDQ